MVGILNYPSTASWRRHRHNASTHSFPALSFFQHLSIFLPFVTSSFSASSSQSLGLCICCLLAFSSITYLSTHLCLHPSPPLPSLPPSLLFHLPFSFSDSQSLSYTTPRDACALGRVSDIHEINQAPERLAQQGKATVQANHQLMRCRAPSYFIHIYFSPFCQCL